MRKDKALIDLLRGLAELIAEEADRNTEFAGRVGALLADVPEKTQKVVKPKAAAPKIVPDVHAEWSARGEAGFVQWLSGQPVPVLRAIITREDLDSTRKSKSWRASERLAAFIAEGLAARRARGGGFLTEKE